jgi:hypothetical protein
VSIALSITSDYFIPHNENAKFYKAQVFFKPSQNAIQSAGEDIPSFLVFKVIFARSDKKGKFLFLNFRV